LRATRRYLLPAILVSALTGACGSSMPGGGSGTGGAAGTGERGGSGGASGSAGTTGSAGSAGAGGTAGATGAAGVGATAGTAGSAGATGSAGTTTAGAGTSGSAGASAGGGGGTGGVAAGGRGGGGAGSGGKAGAGAAGSGGKAGTGGAAGAGDLAKLNMYYLDVTGGRVLTANAQTPTVKVLVPSAGQGPDGVAVDVAGGHIYWTGMGNPSANDGFIKRSDLDGSNVVTLVPAGGTYTPKQMKLDLAGGKMYWSDREGMRVMRANLDGSSVEALVTTGQTDADRMDNSRWCVGIALDLAGGFFYWSQKGPTNGHVGTLRRAHLAMPAGQTSITRTDIEVLWDKLPEPIDIDVDLGAAFIYWTDRADNTVNRGPIEIPAGFTAATRTDRQILVPNVATAIGVALDLPRGKVYYTSGANGPVGRVNLDGSGNENLIPMAGNLTGIALGEAP